MLLDTTQAALADITATARQRFHLLCTRIQL